MKKSKGIKTLVLSAFGLFLLTGTVFISCKKDTNYCSTCVVKNNDGTVIKNYGEKCGTATDADNYEASCRNDAAQLSGTFSCERR